MIGLTNASNKYYVHVIQINQSSGIAQIRVLSKKPVKFDSFSDLQEAFANQNAILLNGFHTASNVKYWITGIQGIGDSGMSGTPWIMFTAYRVTDMAVSTPMYEVGYVTSMSDTVSASSQ